MDAVTVITSLLTLLAGVGVFLTACGIMSANLEADGFSGNIALKSIEGCGKLVLGVMKKQFTSSLSAKIGYLFARKAIKGMRAQLDFNKFGGALLLGLKKPVVKSHGSSKPETIANAIANAAAIHRGRLVPAVEELLDGEDLNFAVDDD